MTGSIALETTYTSETKASSDSIPPLSWHGLAGLVEIANDDFGEATPACSSEQQLKENKFPAQRPGTNETRRH
jgi:hypothetical protein